MTRAVESAGHAEPWPYPAGPLVGAPRHKMVLSVLLAGNGRPPLPDPARHKWDVGTVGDLNSRLTTTLYYGPWQCNQRLMNECRVKCGTPLDNPGCIWLADIKFDGQARVLFFGVEVLTGTRFAVSHCCCNYPLAGNTEALRKEWTSFRDTFRQNWTKRFGSWAQDKRGYYWPAHHVHDIARGGAPKSPDNLLPTPPDVHDIFTKQYPLCHAGKAPWNTVGPDLPYTD